MVNNNIVPKRRSVGNRKKKSTRKPVLIIFDFKAAKAASPAKSERDKCVEALKQTLDRIGELQDIAARLVQAIELEDGKGGRK